MQLLVEQFEKFAAVVLQPANSPVTDAEFFALCAQYPETRTVEIYRSDASVDVMHGALEVRGECAVAGFVLKLERIWAGIPA